MLKIRFAIVVFEANINKINKKSRTVDFLNATASLVTLRQKFDSS